MIKAFAVNNDRLRVVNGLDGHESEIAWADLLEPTRQEELAIEKWLGVGIPTREEMEEIEVSSRLYAENGAFFMTAILPANTEGDNPVMSPVSFVLAGRRLVTVRYHEPRAFQTFPAHAEKADIGCSDGESILLGLLEVVIDRLADVLERVSRDIEKLSVEIFHPVETKASRRDRNFQRLLKDIGRKESLTSNIRDSLASLQRLTGFLGNAVNGKDARERVKTLAGDALSLADHASFLSQKTTFLLDATLGMVNIEQNAIIKIVSLAAVVFLPPTLVASIYGMNFAVMPELQWLLGYPFALVLMVVSAILPYWYFRRRGWF
jgi:magnesium transporter